MSSRSYGSVRINRWARRSSNSTRRRSAIPPESPAWNVDGSQIAYVAGGSLYSLDAAASTLDEARIVKGSREWTWFSPTFTQDGIAAVRSAGRWDGIGSMPDDASSIVLLDSSDRMSIIVESSSPISSLAASPDGRLLLWVDQAGINWTDGERVHRIPGDFVAATWL